MKTSDKHDEKIAKMKFNAVYPHYLKKVEKKGRTRDELHQVIKWLTSYDENELKNLIFSVRKAHTVCAPVATQHAAATKSVAIQEAEPSASHFCGATA